MSGIFAKKGGSFSSAPVFGPHPRRRTGVTTLLTFADAGGKTSHDGKFIKASFESPGLQVNTDFAALTQPVAEAMAAEIAKAIRDNTPPIKESTRKYRESVKRAYARRAPWALERYKDRVPGEARSDRAFNDSGHLVAGIKPHASKKGFMVATTIMGTRNRYVVEAMLRRYVPKLREMNLHAAIARLTSILVKPGKEARAFGKGAIKRRSEKIGGVK